MLSVLIPTLSLSDHLQLCCESIEKNSKYSFEICLWDNSTDHAVEEFASRNGYTYFTEETNLGIARPYNVMAKNAKYKAIFLADDDYYVAKGYDVGALLALKHKAWRSPTQIEPAPRNRGITSRLGTDPSKFQEVKFNKVFHDKAIHTPPMHTPFYPVFLRKDDYLAFGGHNEEDFLGEDDFLIKAFNYFRVMDRPDMISVPNSYIYHFRASTPRSPEVIEKIKADKTRLHKRHGLTESQIGELLGEPREYTGSAFHGLYTINK